MRRASALSALAHSSLLPVECTTSSPSPVKQRTAQRPFLSGKERYSAKTSPVPPFLPVMRQDSSTAYNYTIGLFISFSSSLPSCDVVFKEGWILRSSMSRNFYYNWQPES